MESKDAGIHISGVGGDVMGVEVTGSGNIIGKNLVLGTISPDKQILDRIPKEYADSLKSFTDAINQQFKANQVSSDKVQAIQNNFNNFSRELEAVRPGQDPGVMKTNLKSKLVKIVESTLTILPKTLQVISAFTPLAPFSGLIGEDTQILVQAIQSQF